MPPAPLPAREQERLAALRSYDILDTGADTALDNLVKFAARLTGTPISAVSLVAEERQWFKAQVGLPVSETPREQSFCAHAILEPGQPLIVEDATRDERFADNPLVTGEMGIRFYAGVPLVNPEGHALGALCVIDREARSLSADQKEALVRLAETVGTTLELHRAMRRIRSYALTDSLTGLANRSAFLMELEHAIAQHQAGSAGFALIGLDLDGFKRVNDVHGHLAGDEVLRAVAEVMQEVVGGIGSPARIGGDEFAALLPSAREVEAVGERLRTQIAARMEERGWAVTASIGAVSFVTAPFSVTAALEAVDELGYRAKAAGKNRVMHREH
ncbi:GGDEF domain-containing protein [Sabulicella rubraurantiaca]|uniref:GGDEF domain-containing protein n=1 Tax=Sabulicella rubraurantiaca TaxID=2811429 RepID=UPI001A95E25E|nr:sensor domain-containing diguanylate cyclase [Sabulicella rubraurantiaca]